MPSITYQNHSIESRHGEKLLDAFLRQGMQVAFSCRAGTCQVCTLRCKKGTIPAVAQKGLKNELIEKNYFLACQCIPVDDMELLEADPNDLYYRATVRSKEKLNDDVYKLTLEPEKSFAYRPGQYINLKRWDGLVRSYSLASLPSLGSLLELHVKILAKGQMGQWIANQMQVGLTLDFQGPQGNCYYHEEFKQEHLLMVATGTGVAPLFAIVLDALEQGHQGRIDLYHGSHRHTGLYLDSQLKALEQKYSQFQYHGCISGTEQVTGYQQGRAHEIARNEHPDLAKHVIYACGLPEMIQSFRNIAIQSGVSLDRLFTDAFETPGAHLDPEAETMKFLEESHIFPEPDPEMWNALEQGVLLRKILEDFYIDVYADPELSPFFKVTKEHVIGKQFSFMNEVFTGEDVYFGELPRNAHHWMVISDELFDHRERLMEKALRKHALPEPLIQRWLALEEGYRHHMVKKEPWPKIAFGREFPLDGYDEIEIEFGALCDGCGSAIETGEIAKYHLQLGTLYCQNCTKTLIKA